MDPEFQRAIVIVLVVGGFMGGVGALTLFFAFRAFGGKTAGSSGHFGLIIGLLTFVFICCLLLFALSYAGH